MYHASKASPFGAPCGIVTLNVWSLPGSGCTQPPTKDLMTWNVLPPSKESDIWQDPPA
jgi:hypothetical protein